MTNWKKIIEKRIQVLEAYQQKDRDEEDRQFLIDQLKYILDNPEKATEVPPYLKKYFNKETKDEKKKQGRK